MVRESLQGRRFDCSGPGARSGGYAGQDVQQEAAHEIVGIERHLLAACAALGALIFPAKRGASFVHVTSNLDLRLLVAKGINISFLARQPPRRTRNPPGDHRKNLIGSKVQKRDATAGASTR